MKTILISLFWGTVAGCLISFFLLRVSYAISDQVAVNTQKAFKSCLVGNVFQVNTPHCRKLAEEIKKEMDENQTESEAAHG